MMPGYSLGFGQSAGRCEKKGATEAGHEGLLPQIYSYHLSPFADRHVYFENAT